MAPVAVIGAPGRFHLRGTGQQLSKFLRAIAVRVLQQGKPVVLDFQMVTSFFPAATILFMAELSRIIALSSLPKPVTIRAPRDRKCREVLKQIGIFGLTGDSNDVVPSHRDVVYWRSLSGATSSGDELAPLDAIADQVNLKRQRLTVRTLWRGVTEAVSNSVEHAYSSPREDGFAGLPDRKWWMFTQLRDNTFTVAVCDLGCGYRKTIRRTIPVTFIEWFSQKVAGLNPDVAAIKTAMEYGTSGTGVANRGKGSRDALSVLKRHGSGEMFIASNTGYVSYRLVGETLTEESGPLDSDLRGTIIWWKLPLAGETGD